ncbi:klarsicht protein isoform X2 [Nomia melanderi]|uniref:klarsicht protein isoform X2 n=1 Tax=Nomia melanderi TaxID=2448451 RepID=UPI003FCD18DD
MLDHCKAMKMSFSLSSLQPLGHGLDKHGQVGMAIERPYNSLTKKRKDPKQFSNQRLWTNREDCKDDFWAAIRSNYDYIMSTNLIDSCKEANGELIWDETDVSTQSWSLKEVSSQFSELYSWLSVLQELVYSKEENLLDKSLRAAHMEELRRRAYRRKLFNEQAGKLVSRAPALKDEVAWRVDHLNAKWELVEQIMAPVERPISNQQDISADFEHEVKCLRKWLREMESRLQPLSFHIDWTLAELEEKAVEHMVLQRDIEAHGRIVSSVVKLGDKVYTQQLEKRQEQEEQQEQGNERDQWEPPQALRIVRSLERRWHLLFLRALEWQCHIETLVSRINNKNVVPYRCSSDSDEEPVTKQPRLSRRHSRGSGRESPGQSARSTRSERSKRHRATRSPRYSEDPAAVRADLSDTDASSENRSVGEGSYFEDELCQLCVMDTRSDEVENYQGTVAERIQTTLGDQGEEGDIEEDAVSEDEEDDMPPTPDTVPVTNSTAIEESCDQIDGRPRIAEQSNDNLASDEPVKRRRKTEEVASFSTPDRKSKNCATFYFRHLDTDSEQNEEPAIVAEDSSEEEWTYTSANNAGNASEQRETNVLVRLDFGEATADATATPDAGNDGVANTTANNPVKEVAMECVDETSNETDASSHREKDSDDETRNDKTSIQRLIKEVEKLVGDERRAGVTKTFPQLILDDKGITNNHRAKYARIKEWLKLNSVRGHEGRLSTSQPLDSCDASGEYTTEESDGERQSVSSEDLQSSVATYRRFEGALGCTSQSVSQEIFEDLEKTPVNETNPILDASTPKVVMRSKQKANGPRPWSVSCISQIGNTSGLNQTNDPISQFSISETALHQLIATPPTKSASLDATGSRKSFNNSTSTLLEESIICHDGRVVRNSSLRRKKSRLRKKNLGRKSESSSEGVNANNSAGSDGSSSNQQRSARKMSGSRSIRTISRDCHGRLTMLVKSGSFSGCTAHQQLSAERTIVSDPTPPFRLPCCTSAASTSETEGEDQRNCARGCFSYDDNLLDTVLSNKVLSNHQLNVDSDVEMNSLGNNSFSEQAWDNYQEKYMSEPYSEAPDVETARRLLDFGDDYRNFLDSQSDCASSMSAVPTSSPLPRSRIHHEITDTTEDSDSDVEDVRNVVEKSQSQLTLAENLFLRSSTGTMPEDCTEVECACRENLRCLHTLIESVSNSFRSEKYMKQIRGTMEKWESLTSKVEEAQLARTLHRELTALHTEFKAAHNRLFSYEIVLEQPHVVDEQINRITAELASLRDRKAAMLALNVSTHRLITDHGNLTSMIFTTLKDGVADLYRIWDETFQKGNQQLCALQAVQQFSVRLAELQCALRRDKDTLAVLDVALQAGATSEVASSVRHVARLLSEKQDINCQNGTVLKDTTTEEVDSGTVAKFGDASPISLTQEGGSLSDSGISDSGSEQELSERERRLAALRRLTRSLESQLAPGSEVLADLWKRVEDTETELRDLQKQCRELIVRTAASVEARAAKRTANQIHHFADKRKKASSTDVLKEGPERIMTIAAKCGATDAGDPDNEPGLPDSWIWRILRAALPFQLALLALFYAACHLEPYCCEAANTLNLSLTPQLRYVRGPPPI